MHPRTAAATAKCLGANHPPTEKNQRADWLLGKFARETCERDQLVDADRNLVIENQFNFRTDEPERICVNVGIDSMRLLN